MKLSPSILLVLLLVPSAAAPASAGDRERVIAYHPRANRAFVPSPFLAPCCTGFSPTRPCAPFEELWEHWPATTFAGGAGIPWSIAYTGSSSSGTLAPGLAYCTSTADAPGRAQILAAATTWYVTPPSGPPHQGVDFTLPTLDTALRFDAPGEVFDPASILSPGLPSLVGFVTDVNVFPTVGTAHLVLAVTAVSTDANALITDFDTALNATTYSGSSAGFTGRPVWSWVADLGGVTFASGDPDATNPHRIPINGYADIQGTVTHELGHAAGLGHSVVDSETSSTVSLFPTMFPFAQSQPFEQSVSTRRADCSAATYATSPNSTTFGGIIGKTAKSLASDDIVAINRAYPTAFPIPHTGTITGVVTLNGVGVAGASVVAIQKNAIDQVRIGTLSMSLFSFFDPESGTTTTLPTGTYELSGLPPGQYYVYAEPVNFDPTGSTKTYFVSGFDVPNYSAFPAFQGTPHPFVPGCTDFRPGQCSPNNTCCCQPICSACNATILNALPTTPSFFHREMFNTGDATSEDPQVGTLVTVAEGQTSTGIDFAVNASSTALRLDLAQGASPSPSAFSERAISVPLYDAAMQPTVVTTRVQGGTPNAPVRLYFRYGLSASLVQGQVREVGGGGPATVDTTLDGSGNLTLSAPLSPSAHRDRNVYVQAEVGFGTGTSRFTNTANFFVGSVWTPPSLLP
jgi:hypothetical protein